MRDGERDKLPYVIWPLIQRKILDNNYSKCLGENLPSLSFLEVVILLCLWNVYIWEITKTLPKETEVKKEGVGAFWKYRRL